jgi:serine/threonine protein kinase
VFDSSQRFCSMLVRLHVLSAPMGVQSTVMPPCMASRISPAPGADADRQLQVRFVESFRYQKWPVLVMECCRLGTAQMLLKANMLDRRPHVEERMARRMLVQVLFGLHYLHSTLHPPVPTQPPWSPSELSSINLVGCISVGDGALQFWEERKECTELQEPASTEWTHPAPAVPLSRLLWHVESELDVLNRGAVNGVVHRDIKLENILLDDALNFKLGDFGTAKRITSQLLQTFAGTPMYMAPEVLHRVPYSHKSDIWSLGHIMYELCTFETLYDASTLQSLIEKVRLFLPRTLNPDDTRSPWLCKAEEFRMAPAVWYPPMRDSRLKSLGPTALCAYLHTPQRVASRWRYSARSAWRRLTRGVERGGGHSQHDMPYPKIDPGVYSAELRTTIAWMLLQDPEARPSAKQLLATPHVQRWIAELHESQVRLYNELQPLAASLGVPTEAL